MKKLLGFLLILISTSSFAQTYYQSGNTMQYTPTAKGYVFRTVTGKTAFPFANWRTKEQIDSLLTLKQDAISLTTTGTSGAATFIGGVLNIPQYTAGGGGGTTTFALTNGYGITTLSFDGSVAKSVVVDTANITSKTFFNTRIGTAVAASIATKQAILGGTGLVKSTGGTISYVTDNTSDWNAAYNNRITSLTTAGNNGSASLISNTLNIPTYTLNGLGGQALLSGSGLVKSASGTISYLTDNSSNWNTAYSWGNHNGLYPTYTGTGATGTWGINISGNAATVTGFSGTHSGASSGTNTGDETTSRINSLYGYTPANGANYLPLTAGSGQSLSGILYGKQIQSQGGGAGYYFDNRSDATKTWAWYADTFGSALYNPYTGTSAFEISTTNDVKINNNLYLTDAVKAIVWGVSTSAYIIGSSASNYIDVITNGATRARFSSTGLNVTGSTTATAFVTSGGTSAQVVLGDGSLGAYSAGLTNPMTTSQDIIVGGSSGTPTRLGKGANNTFLTVNGSGNLAYFDLYAGTNYWTAGNVFRGGLGTGQPGTPGFIAFNNGANGISVLQSASGITAGQVWTLPNKTGTVALTSILGDNNNWTGDNIFGHVGVGSNLDVTGTAYFASSVTLNSILVLHNWTVAGLPASPSVGSVAYVTDALAPAYHATVVGGGSVITPVFYNGNNWIVI